MEDSADPSNPNAAVFGTEGYKFFSTDLNYEFLIDPCSALVSAPASLPVPAQVPAQVPAPVAVPVPDHGPPRMPTQIPTSVVDSATSYLGGAVTNFAGVELYDDRHTIPKIENSDTLAGDPQNHSEQMFSDQFDFNKSLVKIFFRIDTDRNSRLDRSELERAVREGWFDFDEDALAKVLLYHYDEFAPVPVIADAGATADQIMKFPLFSDLVRRRCLAPETDRGWQFNSPRGASRKPSVTRKLRKML